MNRSIDCSLKESNKTPEDIQAEGEEEELDDLMPENKEGCRKRGRESLIETVTRPQFKIELHFRP